MNKKTILAAMTFVALTGSLALAGQKAGTGVPGSIHDMTIYGAIGSNDPEATQGRVCAYCHTPHHAITDGNDYLPLWSHTVTSQTFTPYASATIDANIDPTTMMEGPSKLCMSCHDGSVAVDTHYAFTGGKTLQQDDNLFSTPAVGAKGNLSNDHPIGFIYDKIDGGIADGPIGVGGVGNDPDIKAVHQPGVDEWVRNKKSTFYGSNITIEDRLWASASQGGKPIMTCATCHDVHNKKNKDEDGATNYLLLATNKGSALCISCHIK
ncbi:cytochrome c3 family protein [Geomonas sp. RF6]|uniref:cytochrome c3 family protein n=1 Tax=Geomonas sp. RF6 TaxID=2897342 RepID=UPI001E4EF4FB|nr:cytochrome c3 family protein [Geomonas sp. RF6]UFS71060.1 cytochrome c3 family protein [Geomonas sp. RF6]